VIRRTHGRYARIEEFFPLAAVRPPMIAITLSRILAFGPPRGYIDPHSCEYIRRRSTGHYLGVFSYQLVSKVQRIHISAQQFLLLQLFVFPFCFTAEKEAGQGYPNVGEHDHNTIAQAAARRQAFRTCAS